MGRTSSSFERKAPRFSATPKILVICEDTKSGKKYLEDARRYFRADVEIEIIHCGRNDPKGIVDAAIDRLKKYQLIFCMVDRDRHENFDEAMSLAIKHDKIKMIVSYPCFEIWLILHFYYSRKPYAEAGKKSPADCVITDLKAILEMSDYDKGAAKSIFKLLEPRLSEARKNSEKAYQHAMKEGELNPSTLLHELIAHFEELSSPRPLPE